MKIYYIKLSLSCFCLALFACCFLSQTTTSAAVQPVPLAFKDVTPAQWAYETVNWSIAHEITFGFEDQTFRPNEPITEEQFIALLLRSFGVLPTSNTGDTAWSDPFYLVAATHNYPISQRRNTSITRKYTAELISATQGVHYEDKFAIQYLLDNGLAKGETSATIPGFNGNKLLTRAEALQLIKNLQEKLEIKALKNRPKQLSNRTSLQMPALAVEKLHGLGNAEQAIIVTAPSYGETSVKITAYEKTNGIWSEKFAAKQGVIGIRGFSANFHEGDKTTPEGIYTLESAFGKFKNPGTKLPYTKTSPNDYWVDDSQSTYYNTWQNGPVNGRWSSAEKLLRKDDLYDYAVVINYNPMQISGKGSAIFLHIWSSEASGTLGCTAMSKSELLMLMRWLDPSKHPIIVEGTEATISQL
ncbi:hypothetical protein EHS13_04715 [Paenibacillus psychroresistens]|uniref:SLH domain-containing protein n=1 Tax=Paenibacillus psychroresistens TaxID=1778678 RepID=A0A6B8RDI0_9BACL|nr:S-layer homology domain-containing protein [Paenibacillus psychroresistens]QGQ94259.1 hypothetical protein EHS13_04715 [Paenibacillus psychroresistens]